MALLEVTERGAVFESVPGTDRQSCCFPEVCALPGGRWLCSCRAAPTKGDAAEQHVLLSWSDDEGGTWSAPYTPFDPPDVEGKPGLFRKGALTSLGGERVVAALAWQDFSDPSLPFFNEETEGLLEMFLFLARSEDGGASWAGPKPIDTTPFDCPTPLTGPNLVLPNGDWACQFELNKHYEDPAPWRHSSVLMFSSDDGHTWPEHVRVSDDPERRIFYWDQRPSVLADGTLLNPFWTFDRERAEYLNIHARESKDNGRNWSEMWDTGVPGQPAPPVSLPDGGVAMVYVDRAGPPQIKVRTSHDGGRSWPDDTEVVIYGIKQPSQTETKSTMQDAWAEMAKFSVGLPATAPLPDGEFLVVYYAGPRTDETDIRWARLRLRR